MKKTSLHTTTCKVGCNYLHDIVVFIQKDKHLPLLSFNNNKYNSCVSCSIHFYDKLFQYLTKHKETSGHVIKWFTEGSFFKMNWMQICLKVCFIEDLTTTMYMFIQISLGSPLLCDISHWSTISCVMLLIKGPFDIFSWGPFNYIKCDSVYVFLRFR